MKLDRCKLSSLQLKIAERVLKNTSAVDFPMAVRGYPDLVAGLDVSYSKVYGGVAVAVLLEYHTSRLLEVSVAIASPPMEYVPGFLAFREAPLMYTALTGLSKTPQLILVNGHGLSHPRFAGIASHLGAALGIPSIGVAKKRLAGSQVVEGGKEYLVLGGRRVAVVLRAPTGGKLYVSPGYGVNLNYAESVVLNLFKLKKHLPDPLYHADAISRRLARRLDSKTVSPKALKSGRLINWLL